MNDTRHPYIKKANNGWEVTFFIPIIARQFGGKPVIVRKFDTYEEARYKIKSFVNQHKLYKRVDFIYK
jgi:hypothetical protein